MRTTPLRLMMVFAALPVMAAAQTPPTPPARPTPAPAPTARPAPAARPQRVEPVDRVVFEHPDFDMLRPKLEEVRFMAEEARIAAKVDLERMRFDVGELDFGKMRLDMDHAKLALDRAKLDMEHVKLDRDLRFDLDFQVPAMAEVAARIEAIPHRLDGMVRPGFSGDRLLETRPRAPWISQDPADSLYRLARESLNRGEYRRAAQFFNELTKKYPQSGYAQHSLYWEAFARYRLGSTEDLKLGLGILEGKGSELAALSRESGVDVPSLRARILGALAARGDNDAARKLREQSANSTSCDREAVSVRAEALGALGQMDLAAAMPTVRKVLADRDECTIELRRRALYLLGREPTEANVTLMFDVAKNDSDDGIRGEAMSWIARTANDNAVPMLEDLLRTSTVERTQRSAINALGSIDSDRARRAVRTIIERNDAPERVRYDAIISVARTRNERLPSADDVGYLRGLYAKVESQRLKEAVLTAVSRVPTTENQAFLTAIIRNQNEPVSLRSTALQRLVQASTFTVDEIGKLYDVADARSLREQVLYALSRRKEPEAIDKMIEIAKKDTDPQIVRTAISLLSRSNNPRALQYLQELVNK
jgi:HEAT repeat protein